MRRGVYWNLKKFLLSVLKDQGRLLYRHKLIVVKLCTKNDIAGNVQTAVTAFAKYRENAKDKLNRVMIFFEEKL